MKRSILAAAIWLVFATSAWAGYDEGYRAYWRGDYATALREFRPLADRGEVDAQFMLGQMYASGQGVLQDYVQAHLWYNLAAAGGHDRAPQARDQVGGRMTGDQVAEAQHLARAWRPQAGTKPPSKPKVAAAPSPSGMSERERIAEVQRHLATLNYQPGVADGKMGWKTRSAIRSYQQNAGLRIDGEPSPALLGHLRGAVAAKSGGQASAAAAAKPKKQATKKAKKKTQGSPAGDYDKLAKGLKAAIADARTRGLADPAFLKRLEKLIASSARPARKRIIFETFEDGEYFQSPTWSVLSGSFTVDVEKSLVSSVLLAPKGGQGKVRAEDVAVALLGQMLGAQSQGSAEPKSAERAEIYLPKSISGDFVLDTTLQVDDESVCEVGVVSGPSRDVGYRLTLAAGERPSLVGRKADRNTVVARGDRALPAVGRHEYAVRWHRSENGQMVVRLNRKEVIRIRDTEVAPPFSGVVHANRLGDCALKRLAVTVPE